MFLQPHLVTPGVWSDLHSSRYSLLHSIIIWSVGNCVTISRFVWINIVFSVLAVCFFNEITFICNAMLCFNASFSASLPLFIVACFLYLCAFFTWSSVLGLPYVPNFPDLSGISVLKFVSGNNFKKCSDVRNFVNFRGSHH